MCLTFIFLGGIGGIGGMGFELYSPHSKLYMCMDRPN